MEIPLGARKAEKGQTKGAVQQLWESPYDVDHNTAANLYAGKPPVYATGELVKDVKFVSGSEADNCRLPDPEKNWVPNAEERVIPCSNPGGEAFPDGKGENPIILVQ